jgi:ABC-type transport system involved in cytochrome bd biosynthesis fused ATPase/permease subunit
MTGKVSSSAKLRFGPRNFAFLGAAVVALVVGYAMLAGGSITLAPILLVLGYCVLFPLGLAL